MKFFIPGAENKKEEESVYNSIKKFVGPQVSGKILDTKIYRIDFSHDGKQYQATVGEITNFNGETVIAILEADNLYCVCTPKRGVVRDLPIFVGKHYDTHIVQFDKDTS